MTSNETLMKKHKLLLSGIFIVIFIAGLAVIISNKSVSPGEFIASFQDLNPRFMSLLALPVIALLFVLGAYWRKKNEERKWKKALLKTRARKRGQGVSPPG
jgi:preprotein translocase subunit SecG